MTEYTEYQGKQMFKNGISGLKVACSALSYKIYFQLSKRLFSVIIFYSLFVKALECSFLEENNFPFVYVSKFILELLGQLVKCLPCKYKHLNLFPRPNI